MALKAGIARTSINPPLDIVLDVVKAADPAKYKEAVAKLTRLAPNATPADFAALLDSTGTTKPLGNEPWPQPT